MTNIKKIPASEITPEHIYNDRRNFIKITKFDYLVKSGKNENIC